MLAMYQCHCPTIIVPTTAQYRIAATLQLLLFFFISVFAFPPPNFGWSPEVAGEFFKMPVLMLMLITVLNDGASCHWWKH